MTLPADLLGSGVLAQAAAVAAGETTALDLVESALARISSVDPRVNAFTVVLADRARAEAAERDAALARGETPGPLHGVPVAIKEENVVEGTVTTYGGHGNETPAARDGHVAQRLREAGAVIVGRTNMPEFGAFPFTESTRFGVTRNPWDVTRSPGGSSGGSAAAVASAMVPAAIGGDGGGSIRIPSALCGLFGLKPTRGRVSAHPAPDLWGALGVLGVLTRSVRDSAAVYDVIRGSRPSDRFAAPEPVSSFSDAASLSTPESQRRLRVGWSTRPVVPGVRAVAEHVAAVEETASLLSVLGHDVREVDPRLPDVTAAFLPQVYAGIRAGLEGLERPGRADRRTRDVARMGMWARPGLVRWAERRGEHLAAVVDERVFADLDLLLMPVVAGRPPELDVLGDCRGVTAQLRSLPWVSFVALWNTTGHPAASVPTGLGPDGLPVGVQLVARRGEETTILAAAAQLEAARPWADRWPAL